MTRKLFLGLFVAVAMMSCSKEDAGADQINNSGIQPEGKPNEEWLYGPIKEYTYSVTDGTTTEYVKMKFDKDRRKILHIESKDSDFSTFYKKEEIKYQGGNKKEVFFYSDNSTNWYRRRVWDGGSYKDYNTQGVITSSKRYYKEQGKIINEFSDDGQLKYRGRTHIEILSFIAKQVLG